jgi:hypothetical protein
MGLAKTVFQVGILYSGAARLSIARCDFDAEKSASSQGHSVFADGTLSNDETAYGLESNQEISLAANVAAMRISVAYVKTEWPWRAVYAMYTALRTVVLACPMVMMPQLHV